MSLREFLAEHVGAVFVASAIGVGSLTINNAISLARQESRVEALTESLQDLQPSIEGLRSETSQARQDIAALRGELASARTRNTQ